VTALGDGVLQIGVDREDPRPNRREGNPVKRSLKAAAQSHQPPPRDRGSLRLAHQHILGKIAAGELPAGAALSEVSLATQLGVSRTPVREAIGRLVAEGILQKSNRGAVVAEATRQDIIELYELREAVEVYGIGKVAESRLSPRMLKLLEPPVEQVRMIAMELKKSGKPALEGEALQKFIACDLRFHTLLLQAGGNQRMLKILDSTRLLLRIFTLRREHHTVKLLGNVYNFHRRILDAVASGLRDEAMRLLGEHIRLSLEERLAEYEDPRQVGYAWSPYLEQPTRGATRDV
jgi:DNA-binding GntR family transcriptional regulator